MIHYGDDVACHQLVGWRRLATRAAALTATIDCDHLELVERGQLIRPVITVAQAAVEKNDRWTLTKHGVVDLGSGGIDEAAGGGCGHRGWDRQLLPARLLRVSQRRSRRRPRGRQPGHGDKH